MSSCSGFPHIWGALCDIELEGALAPINLFEVQEKDEVILAGSTWSDPEFEVALHSRAGVHACVPGDRLGYALEESPASQRNQEFLMGDGGAIVNLDKKFLNLLDEAVGRDLWRLPDCRRDETAHVRRQDLR